MDMKRNLVLNQTSSKFFVKMTGTEGLQNPKNWSQEQTGGSIKEKKTKKRELQPGSGVHFEIKNWTTWVHTSTQER
jgi:hypothetical protein